MDNLDFKEKIWGGIFGIVAICAAVAEMFINGMNASSVVGAVKDVSGTLVVVVILIAFIKSLPKKPKNVKEKLEVQVENWGNDNVPFIFKIKGYKAAKDTTFTQGFNLLQDPNKYIDLAKIKINEQSADWDKYALYGNGKETGKFIDMPSYEEMTQKAFEVVFTLEQSHFKNDENTEKNIDKLVDALKLRESEKLKAERVGKQFKIKLIFNAISSDEDIEFFIDTLDFVLSLVKVIV